MVSLLLGLVLLLCALGNLYGLLHAGVNADLLHLPMMFKDCATGQLNWFFWSLPPSRYIFPDIPVFFAINSLTGNGVWALLVNACFYFFFVLGLLVWALKLFTGLQAKKTVLPVLLTLTILTIPNLFPEWLQLGLCFPSYHAGALVWSLLGYCFLGLWLKNPTALKSLGLCLVAFGAGVCDPLCFVEFVMPAAVMLCLWRGTPGFWKMGLLMASVVLILAVLGDYTGSLLVPWTSLQSIHHEALPLFFIQQAFRVLFSDLANPLVMMSVLSFVVGGFLFWQNSRQNRLNRGLEWGLWVLVWLPLGASVLNGRYYDIQCWRYFIISILFLLGVIVFTLFFKRRIFFFCAVAAVCLFSFIYIPRWPRWAELNYPAEVRDLDILKNRLGLKSGLAQYWRAKPIRYFSRNGLVVNALDYNGHVQTQVVNLAWLGLPYTPSPALEYNFIVVFKDLVGTPDIDEHEIYNIYGKPKAIYSVVLGDKEAELLVYNYDLASVLKNHLVLWRIISERLNKDSYFLQPQDFRFYLERLTNTVKAASIPSPVP